MEFKLIIDRDAPEEVVARVRQRSGLTDQIEELVRSYAGEDMLPGYSEDDMRMLRFTEIECIIVEGGKTYAVDGKGVQYRLKLRLYELEEMLPSCFIRINKSALANEKHLVRFVAGFGGSVDAVFRCGRREYVSRRCFAEIKRRFDGR
ncbi:MAG: LytTR family transcriptional regulator [Clostridiales bacterium]|nr:LytTR family transcriptional regulator [Clostridiales bacterium]